MMAFCTWPHSTCFSPIFTPPLCQLMLYCSSHPWAINFHCHTVLLNVTYCCFHFNCKVYHVFVCMCEVENSAYKGGRLTLTECCLGIPRDLTLEPYGSTFPHRFTLHLLFHKVSYPHAPLHHVFKEIILCCRVLKYKTDKIRKKWHMKMMILILLMMMIWDEKE